MLLGGKAYQIHRLYHCRIFSLFIVEGLAINVGNAIGAGTGEIGLVVSAISILCSVVVLCTLVIVDTINNIIS